MLSATRVLATIESQRLLKATQALVDGSSTVSLIRQTEEEVRAMVKNGDGIEYSVIVAAQPFCGCKDFLFRSTCKHLALVALYVLRHPRQEPIANGEDISSAQALPVSPTLDDARTMTPQEMQSYNLRLCRARREHGERRAT